MSNPKTTYFDEGDVALWSKRLAAEDWSWVTWKFLLGDTALVILWALLMLTLIMLILPKSRKQLAYSANIQVSGGTFCSAFIFTWLAGTFAHGAIFGGGPFGYWLHQLLGANRFETIADWSFRYLTFLGILFSW
jgi:hypothetical protein